MIWLYRDKEVGNSLSFSYFCYHLFIYSCFSFCSRLSVREMASYSSICCLLFVFMLVSCTRGESPYRFFNWNVTYGDIYPLGVKQQVRNYLFLFIFFPFCVCVFLWIYLMKMCYHGRGY